MNRSETIPADQTYRDRSQRLAVLGTLDVLIAALFVLQAVLSFLPALPLPGIQAGAMPLRSMIAAALFHLCVAALFVAAAVGSFRARRWVPALMRIAGWAWLVGGLAALVFVVWMTGTLLGDLAVEGGGPPGWIRAAVLAAVTVAGGVLMVGIPVILIRGYSIPDVRATCEARNPEPCWTDRCPPQVLGWSLGMALTSLLFLAWPWTAPVRALPVFGIVLRGSKAVAMSLGGGVISGWLAWATYRRRWMGWWGSLAVVLLGGASFTVAVFRQGLPEVYEILGYPAQQVDVIRKMPGLEGAGPGWAVAGFHLLLVAYLIYLVPLFRRRGGVELGR